MSQNLSFSSIAATLAVLSASGLVACGGASTPPAESPADAKEVPAATTAGATAATEAAPPKDEVNAAEGASAAVATPAPEAPKADAAAAAATPTTAPASKDDKPKATGKKKAGAKAGCGAGTCG